MVAGLNVLIALGAAFMSYRGHTSAGRFADKVKDFSLTSSFVADAKASESKQPGHPRNVGSYFTTDDVLNPECAVD